MRTLAQKIFPGKSCLEFANLSLLLSVAIDRLFKGFARKSALFGETMKVKSIKFLAMAALAASITACTPTDTIHNPHDTTAMWREAPAAYQQAVEAADWNTATVIDMTLFDNHFTPMLLSLKKGAPYVLKITNKEKHPRLLVGEEFLGTLAVNGASGNDEVTKSTVMETVYLDPQEPREIRFIPMESGRYEFRRAGHVTFNAMGRAFEPFKFMPVEAYGVAYVE